MMAGLIALFYNTLPDMRKLIEVLKGMFWIVKDIFRYCDMAPGK